VHNFMCVRERFGWTLWQRITASFRPVQAYYILDELLIAGEHQETSKKTILKVTAAQDAYAPVAPCATQSDTPPTWHSRSHRFALRRYQPAGCAWHASRGSSVIAACEFHAMLVMCLHGALWCAAYAKAAEMARKKHSRATPSTVLLSTRRTVARCSSRLAPLVSLL
jgi:hypothetical protein